MAVDRLKELLALAKAKQTGSTEVAVPTIPAVPTVPVASKAAVALSPEDQVRALIIQLSEELEQEIPGYSKTLRVIHKRLLAEEELTHILSEEEIGVIMNGQKKITNTVIKTVTEKAESKKATASLKKLGATITVDQL